VKCTMLMYKNDFYLLYWQPANLLLANGY
jgi:hypothetical protein